MWVNVSLQESGLAKDLEERERTDTLQISQLREKMDSLLAEKEELIRQLSEANRKLEDSRETEGDKEHLGTLEKKIEVCVCAMLISNSAVTE